MKSIDLNCDLGEGCDNDARLMPLISSANIACGFHAGDAETMLATAKLAAEQGVAIGAHPGYPDKENFGRTGMSLEAAEIERIVAEQVHALREICHAIGARLSHVKPHGALYNQAASQYEIAEVVARAVRSIDPSLLLYGLSGSHSIAAAERMGLQPVAEVFADRTYRSDGSLTLRSETNALIHDAEQSLTQVLDMVKYGRVRSTDAIMVAIRAETICIHGDGANAVRFAFAINGRLTQEGITIKAPAADRLSSLI